MPILSELKVGVGIVLILLLGYCVHYYGELQYKSGLTDGIAKYTALKTETDAQAILTERKISSLTTQVAQRSSDLQTAHDQIKVAYEKVDDVNSKLAAAITGVRNPLSTTIATTGLIGITPSSGSTNEYCKPDRLFGDYQEYFLRVSAAADDSTSKLNQCIAQYNSVQSKVNGWIDKDTTNQ